MGETTEPGRVLYVGDDRESAAATADRLETLSDGLLIEAVVGVDEAVDRLSTTAVDCVVHEGDDLAVLEAVREMSDEVPFFLVTDTDRTSLVREVLAYDGVDVVPNGSGPREDELLANRIEHAVERYRAIRRATAVERGDRLVGAVCRALVGAETRTEIERRVCEILDDVGRYAAVWIGAYDAERRVVEPRAAAGDDVGSLDGVEIEVASGGGETGRAVRTREPVVSDRATAGDVPLGDGGLIAGSRAAVAVPLIADGTLHGVLHAYADRAETFDDRERETLTTVGSNVADALDRAETRASRERRNRQFRSAVEHAGHVVLLTDADGEITYVNDAFETTTGYAPSEAVGRRPSMLQSGQHDEAFYADLWETISSGEVWEGEVVNERKDGTRYVIHQTIAPITDDDGITGFVAINRDITDRKERELNLAFLKRAIDQAGIGIGTYGADGYATYVNERLAELFGTTREDLRSRHMGSLDPSLDRDRFPAYWESFDDGERRIYDTRIERLDTGERCPVEVVTSRVHIDGEPYQVNTVRDAAERKRQERDLERFRSAVEHAGHSVLVTDADGHIEYVNDAFEELSGYSAAEAVGRTPALLNSDEHDETFYRDLWETILQGEVWHGEVTNERKDGEQYVVDQTIAPITGDGDEITGFVAINRDVTELKAYERELKAQNDRLKQYGQTVAHDLRNPLALLDAELKQFRAAMDAEAAPISADGNTVSPESDGESATTDESGTVDAAAVRDLCTSIETTVDRMETLIEDLLTMAEHGQRVLNAESVSLEALATEAWEQVDADGADLSVDDADIDADPDRLRELLSNLFRNAVEHGGDGVNVRVGPLDFSAGFAVEDDGPGIPPAERDSVFERGFTTATDGTGFGLAIVDQIADAHGWTVSVTDGHDGGARFEFRVDDGE
ncbi:PAS domain S-box protein [Haloplanus pelagicus]|uniref:PAS domain S-box protein n=1 Tax=Haloplanus pelagicus TaxID=2949995 RepID=UPI00203ACE4F|nr:PAS domain S-box protein [Haloplanus sp. HW8-1]